MTFGWSKCPTCGSDPRGTLETVTGIALIQRQGNQHFEYSGETDMLWDEQHTVKTSDGRVTLLCPHGHAWQTRMR